MRLTPSTLFAAALVFGGTLLFAGYRGQRDQTVWHCPEAQHILAGKVPRIFDKDQEVLSQITPASEWVAAYMFGFLEESDGMVFGDKVTCEYKDLSKTNPSNSVSLSTRQYLRGDRELRTGVEIDVDGKGPWMPVTELDMPEPGYETFGRYSCYRAESECEFVALKNPDAPE